MRRCVFRRRRQALVTAQAISAAAVVLTLIARGSSACGGSLRASAPALSCNGSPSLCSRPLNEAIFAAGLRHYAATLNPHEPLPTLGELIKNDHRLLLFAEKQGGTPAWYVPAFSFIEDTPLGALHPGELSCARYRGNQDAHCC